jgi:hypothetical protein
MLYIDFWTSNLQNSGCLLHLALRDASNAFIAVSETAQWPFCLRTVQAAASAESPFRYASMKRHNRLINRRMTSTGQASSHFSTAALA